MANIIGMISTLLAPGFHTEVPSSFHTEVPSSRPAEDFHDRLDHDLIGVSDSDAMWYYEMRKWRGRD
jgi:hypothetical protein